MGTLRKSIFAISLGLMLAPCFFAGNAVAGINSGSPVAGPGASGGGDACEDRIKVIRDDLKAWISNGGSAGLKLPQTVTLHQYNTSMPDFIGRAQVSCTDRAVKIGSADKTCRFFWNSSGIPQIECNRTAFVNETKEDDQYVLVHHEYAGLAGFEVTDGEDSKYPISNQITTFLENQVIKRLVVKSPGAQATSTAVCVSNIFIATKKDEFQVRGPTLSMNGSHDSVVKVPQNGSRQKIAYNVKALQNGQINLELVIGRVADGQMTVQQAYGFTTGDVFTKSVYDNIVVLSRGPVGGKRCQIAEVTVLCAENLEIANRLLWRNEETGKPYKPDLEKMPAQCVP